MRRIVLLVGIGLMFGTSGSSLAPPSGSPILDGIVTSSAEGPMEGVLVSAKRVGGTITVTVVTDEQGRFSFPANRLTPGEYQLRIRAIGYDSEDSHLGASVGTAKREVDIKLKKTRDLASQLSDAEWLMSVPGTYEQKRRLFINCDLCHSFAPILKSTYDASGWMTTLARMHNWIPGSLLTKPILSPFHKGALPGDEEFANYLSSVNLSSRPTHNFQLKMLPRPRGADTRVVVIEYDLPRPDVEPHDAVMDAEGMVWYSDYAEPVVGRLNPRTGEVREWRDPLAKPGYNGGFLEVELDREGNPWAGRPGIGFNGLAKFDKKTGTFRNFAFPVESDRAKKGPPIMSTGFIDITRDGKVWDRDIFSKKAFRLDPLTAEIRAFDGFPPEIMSKDYRPKATIKGYDAGAAGSDHLLYGIRSDSEGNLYETDIEGGNILKIDGMTGKVTMYPTPTPDSGPRRMHIDSEDRLWIGEYYGGKIAMFDSKTGKFQEWSQPIPWYGPYDVEPDRNGYLWTGSMSSDLITRLNPKTGEFRHYLLPSLGANVRRVDVDNSGTQPALWVGENHRARIARVEPLSQ